MNDTLFKIVNTAVGLLCSICGSQQYTTMSNDPSDDMRSDTALIDDCDEKTNTYKPSSDPLSIMYTSEISLCTLLDEFENFYSFETDSEGYAKERKEALQKFKEFISPAFRIFDEFYKLRIKWEDYDGGDKFHKCYKLQVCIMPKGFNRLTIIRRFEKGIFHHLILEAEVLIDSDFQWTGFVFICYRTIIGKSVGIENGSIVGPFSELHDRTMIREKSLIGLRCILREDIEVLNHNIIGKRATFINNHFCLSKLSHIRCARHLVYKKSDDELWYEWNILSPGNIIKDTNDDRQETNVKDVLIN